MKKINIILVLIFFLYFPNVKLCAVISQTCNPLIGAQVLIEQGQSEAEINHLFRTLSECNMKICRIRMFESYMKGQNDEWDFNLFDNAFRAAEKYDIEIYATLFPFTELTDIGGFKFPFTVEHQQSIETYIKQTVSHFSKFKSLKGWVILNEPGSGKAPFDKPFTKYKFNAWKLNYSPKPTSDDTRPCISFAEDRFLLDYNTWYLNWLTQLVRAIEPTSHIHVNNHAIFENYSEYNFPKWREFLSSLGGSAHASWHYGMFDRKDYHYAMSANCEIIRSGAGKLPWIMTEVQAGNNIWSGSTPMCPTANEIEQWMWTILGTGGKGMIFWSLNPRSTGIESGEWAMLDNTNRPTDRLLKASEISKIVQLRPDLFNNTIVKESGITLLYTRESMWAERISETISKGPKFSGRLPGAGMKSLIGFYEALSQMGIQSNIQSLDEYVFEQDNTGKTIIIANQCVIPLQYQKQLENFVFTGGTLLIEGLSGFFDQYMRTQNCNYAHWSDLFGGKTLEVKFISPAFETVIDNNLKLPSHGWQTTIIPNPNTNVIIKSIEENAIFTIKKFGKGRTLWFPTLIGLEAQQSNNLTPLSQFIEKFLVQYLPANTVRFSNVAAGTLMRVLQTNNAYVVVIINKKDIANKVNVILPNAISTRILNKNIINFKSGTTEYVLNPEETLVIEYKITKH